VPKKQWVRVEPRLERSQEFEDRLLEAGIDLMGYENRDGRYRFRLAPDDIDRHTDLLRQVFLMASQSARGA
jgi:hypothetical protein